MNNVTSLQSLRHNDKTVRLHDGANPLPRALALKATGRSVSSIASELDIPRTTLRDQLVAHDAIEIADAVKNAFVTSEGQAFLKRLNIAAHVCFRNACECGLRVLGNFFEMTGLDALLGASLGCQWKFGRAIDEGIVEYGQDELAQMAPFVAGKEITAAVDENFHEGACLVGIEPASNFILTEQLTGSRETKDWQDAMLPVLAHLGVKVVQVTSDSGTAILALCEKIFGAHHSPDLFHIFYDFRRAFTPAIRAVRRALERELRASESEAASIVRMEARWLQLRPAERGPGRPPDFQGMSEQEEQKQIDLFSRLAYVNRLEQGIVDVLKHVSQGYHPVSLETGKRTGEATLGPLLSNFSERVRFAIAELELASFATDAIEKFERMGAKMLSTLKMVTTKWHSRAVLATADAKEAFALENYLAPAAYLERIAKRSKTLDAHELLKKAAELRASARSSLSDERIAELNSLAKNMADDFQRSSSMVEGRNGALSLRHHAFHELSPLKREVLTVMHNFVTLRADGTTAGERFSSVKPKCLITWLCKKIKVLPQAGGKRILCKAS